MAFLHHGRKKEESVQLLYKYFCNNLYLGQWEVAKSCIQKLRDSPFQDKICAVLRSVATYPYNVRLDQKDIGIEPTTLSLLCLEQLGDTLHDKFDIADIGRSSEMQMLMIETCENAPSHVIKEIYNYHTSVSHGLKHGNEINSLSSDLLQFFKESLQKSPDTTNCLIQKLIYPNKNAQIRKNNDVLQAVYIKTVQIVFKRLSGFEANQENDVKIRLMLQLLSLYDPEPLQNYVLVRELFCEILSSQLLVSSVSKKQFVSTLIGKSNTYLIEEWFKIDYEQKFKKLTEEEKKTIKHCSLNEKDKFLLSVGKTHKDIERIFQILSWCIKQKEHYLTAVLETGIKLIQMDLFDELESLFNSEELLPLKPLLVLHGWTLCKNSDQAKKLLNSLWNGNETCEIPGISVACNKLSYQIDLIQWCLDRTKPLMKVEDGHASSNQQRAAEMFLGLETHSVLYVLHHSTRIASLAPEDIVALLQKSPPQSDTKRKIVRFSSDSSEETQVVTLDRIRDISIFQGFIILKTVMDIIYLGSEQENSSLSASDATLLSHQKDYQDKYNEDVVTKLNSVRGMLSKLQPLTFRVEILENILSLLFVSHEDFQESSLIAEWDSGEIEYDSSRNTTIDEDSHRHSILSEESVSPVPELNDVFLVSQNESSLNYDEPFVEPKGFYNIKRQNSEGKFHSAKKTLHKSLSTGNMESVKNEVVKVEKHDFMDLVQKSLESGRRGSGTCSTGQSMENSFAKFGFLCSEYLVRDILALLKECLIDLSAARFKLLGGESSKEKSVSKGSSSLVDIGIEESLTKSLQSSVSPECLQTRIGNLTQCVHQAHWRFQLVKSECTPKEVGKVLPYPLKINISSCEEEKKIGAALYEIDEKISKQKSFKQVEKNMLHSSKHPADHDSSDNGQENVVCRRKRRSISKNSKRLGMHPIGIIPFMLSSPETLLCMCIQKGNLTQAAQVMQLLKLSDRPESVEVNFSQQYAEAIRKIYSLNISSPCKETKPGKSNMKSLMSAAASGIAVASVADIADRLLSTKFLPQLPSVRIPNAFSAKLNWTFQQENIEIMILFDMLCVGCRTWDMCNNVFDIIKTRLSTRTAQTGSKDTSKKSKAELKLCGVQDLLKIFEDLMQLGSQSDIHQNHLLYDILIGLYKHSIQTFLQTATFSLSAQLCKKYAEIISHMKRSIDRVNSALSNPSHGRKLSSAASDGSKSSPKSPSSPKSSPSLQAYSRNGEPERPIIHTCMKQLYHLFEKELPVGGLSALFSGHICNAVEVNRNYLQSLYEHLKGLAFVVAENENPGDANKAPRNYFVMLSEGPIDTVGRLIFLKRIPPIRLEKVAHELSLNLTHIIVHNCCPSLHSKHSVPVLTNENVEEKTSCTTKPAMNVFTSSSQVHGKDSDSPVQIVCDIVTKLFHYMKEIAEKSNAKGIFDICSAVTFVRSAEYLELILSTQKLVKADLDNLKSSEEKLCFYGNLQNLMYIHMVLHQIQTALEKEKDFTDEDTKYNGLSLFNDWNLPQQLAYMNWFSYQVGQLDLISLFDLKYKINRHGLMNPSTWNCLLDFGVFEVDQFDPWHKYLPPVDPQLLFVTTECCQSSPPVQVLVPELLKNQLETSVVQYVNNTVFVDLEKQNVSLPELLVHYKSDFSSEQKHSAPNEGILYFINELLLGSLKEDLHSLIRLDGQIGFAENIDVTGRKELPFHIDVDPFRSQFMVTFDHEVLKNSFRPLNRRASSVPKDIDLSLDSSSHSSSISVNPSYQLTPMTLDYIKCESSLVATLVSLVCSDELDEIEEHFEADHFTKPELRERTPSEISLMDVRSYRYQKLTDDFPSLKRRLLNYMIPLAAAEDEEILKSKDPLLKMITSNFSARVRTCMLTLHDSQEYMSNLGVILSGLLFQKKFSLMLNIFSSFPEDFLKSQASLCALHDFVLTCLIKQTIKNFSESTFSQSHNGEIHLPKDLSSEICRLLHQFLSYDIMTRVLIHVHRKLTMEQNLIVFNYCSHSKRSKPFEDMLTARLADLMMYNKVCECARNIHFKMSMRAEEFPQSEEKIHLQETVNLCMDWRNLTNFAVVLPENVLTVILKAKDFGTAKEWCQYHQLPIEKIREINEGHIMFLLRSNPPETNEAFLLLNEVKSDSAEECLDLCKHLLKVLDNQKDVLFIVNFVLNHLNELLNNEQKEEMWLLHIGAKMLLCLPYHLQRDYFHLTKEPILILEQLLMNTYVDLAGKAFLSVIHDTIQHPTVTQSSFNHLITKYAKKALEITTVEFMIFDKERTHSQLSTTSSEKQYFGNSPSVGKKSFMTESMRTPRKSVDLGQRRASSLPKGNSPASAGAMMRVDSKDKFVIPPEPPSKDKWVPDNFTDTCMVCNREKFSMFSRRHHCRRCGRLVCSTCSANTSNINGILSRICDECYQFMSHGIQRDSLGSLYGRGEILPDQRPSLKPVVEESDRTDENTNSDLSHVFLWQLKPEDEEYNCLVRDDFAYEQAPSASLCVSILSLHSNSTIIGQLMLQLCDDLSKHFKAIKPDQPNPEIDYSFILSMMKTLLFHAKIRFADSGGINQGITQCELYQKYIDLLTLLVSNNFTDLPSLQELTKPDVVRRLRDKLIEDERLSLAVEVSTKCGLDPTGVWSAWGLSCLQGGDFPKAREMFSRCLKVPKDRNSDHISTLLKDIIQNLELMNDVGSTELQILMASTGSTKNLLLNPTRNPDENTMDTIQFQECLFYLRTYGNYHAIIDFHRKNGFWMKAVQYILDHKCVVDVFVNALLAPAIKSGKVGDLTDQMIMIDPTLERWNPYLKGTCRYMFKHQLFHMLYDFQLFMKDFIRAAMSCITFYQRSAHSYLELHSRLHYLYKALQHMQSYLDPSQWNSVTRGDINDASDSALDSAVRMIQTPEEVSKHIKTIGLQIELTIFLHQCLTSQDAPYASGTYKRDPNNLPTLFLGNKYRADLAIMVMTSSKDIVTAFDLSIRMIKEYKLGVSSIFSHCARELAKQHRYDEIHLLLSCMNKADYGDDDIVDELLGACVLVASDNADDSKEVESLIKIMRKDSNKINAYILCGKLRSAYLMAVKSERVEDVQRIASAAQRMGQTAVKNICNKWLQQQQKR